jgi:sulfatase maturation enzyme AslB (radical SAM superfamily)
MNLKKILYWGITGTCQLSCSYCFYETGVNKRPIGYVNLDTVKSVIPQIAEVFDKIVLTGGEPLLHPNFKEVVTIIKKTGLRLELLTDGIYLNEEIIELLIKIGIERIAVSLDSINHIDNEQYRSPKKKSPKTTETTIKNLRYFAAHKPDNLEIVVLQTITRTNVSCILPMQHFCNSLNINHIVHPADVPNNSLELRSICWNNASSDEIRQLEECMINWANGDFNKLEYVDLAVDLIKGVNISKVTCPMGDSSYFINTDGVMYPCFHREDYPMGMVNNQSISKLLENSTFIPMKSKPCGALRCACMLE